MADRLSSPDVVCIGVHVLDVLGGPVDEVPTRDLVWGAAPGLAEVFGALVRELSARHVGSMG